MDIRTGEILDQNLFNMLSEKEKRNFIPMKIAPTPIQIRRVPPKVGRNEPCPCGSGKKFKNCCWTGKENNSEK